MSAMKLAPPTPPPLPPLPPPTQHVLVNLPPELVDRFASHGPAWLSWLTQPIATLIAASGAIVAASIAFWAVNRQIEGNKFAVAAQIAEERTERRRAERLDLAAEGTTLVRELAQIAFAYQHFSGTNGGSVYREGQGSQIEKFYKLEVLPTSRRMALLGMRDSSAAVEAVYEQARLAIVPLPDEQRADASTVEQERDKAITTLKASLEQKVTPDQVLPPRKKRKARHGS